MNNRLKLLATQWKSRVLKLTPLTARNPTSNSMIVFIFLTFVVFAIAYFIQDNIMRTNLFLTFVNIIFITFSIFFISDNTEENAIENIKSVPKEELYEALRAFLHDNGVSGKEGKTYLEMPLVAHSETVSRRRSCGERALGYIIPIATGIFGVLVGASDFEHLRVGVFFMYFLLTVFCVVLFFTFLQIYQIFIGLFDAKYVYLQKTLEFLEKVTGEGDKLFEFDNEHNLEQ